MSIAPRECRPGVLCDPNALQGYFVSFYRCKRIVQERGENKLWRTFATTASRAMVMNLAGL